MSDHFEKAMQGIALRSKENGGARLDDLLKAIVATNEDLDAHHEETLSLFDKQVERYRQRAGVLAAECRERHRLLFADGGRVSSESAAVDHAALVADAAEMAANKVAAQVESAAREAASAREASAKEAASARVDAAKTAAAVLVGAADDAPKKFTRDQLVSNFWLLVGLLIMTGVIGGVADQLIKFIFN